MRERIIMAQKAIDEVTLVDVTDGETGVSVDSITSFYYLGTDTTPSQPTTLSPPDPWTSIEPRYQENRTLYRSERTLYKDGTFAYSQVQTDSAYAAAADAYKKSMQVSSDLTAYINAMKIVTDDMQSQIDGAITTWFKPYAPTDDQLPTTDWNTTDLKNNHLGDLFYNTITGYVYRYQVQNNVYSWQRISDNDVVKAMEDAAKAQDTADSKRQVFVVTPKPPYDIGDLWVQGSGGDIMKCRIVKAATQSYSADDWVVASKYTDDTTANAAKQAATVAANKITISDHIPTASDSANKAIGSVWEVRSGSTVLSRYILESANTWKQVKVGQDFIGENAIGNAQVANLDVAKLTAGEADLQDATARKIAAQIISSALIQSGDSNPRSWMDVFGFHTTDLDGNIVFDTAGGNVKATTAQLIDAVAQNLKIFGGEVHISKSSSVSSILFSETFESSKFDSSKYTIGSDRYAWPSAVDAHTGSKSVWLQSTYQESGQGSTSSTTRWHASPGLKVKLSGSRESRQEVSVYVKNDVTNGNKTPATFQLYTVSDNQIISQTKILTADDGWTKLSITVPIGKELNGISISSDFVDDAAKIPAYYPEIYIDDILVYNIPSESELVLGTDDNGYPLMTMRDENGDDLFSLISADGSQAGARVNINAKNGIFIGTDAQQAQLVIDNAQVGITTDQVYISAQYAQIAGMMFARDISDLGATANDNQRAIVNGQDEYVYKNNTWAKIPKVPIAGTAFNCDSNSTSWEASFANVTTSDGDAPLTLGTYLSKKGILIPESGYYEIWGMLNLRVSTTKVVKAAVGRPNQDWQYIGYYTNIDFGTLPNGWCMTPFVKTIVYLLKGDILTLRLVDGGNGSFTWGTQTRLDIQYLHP
jgi:hypothetical protein